MDEFQQIEQVSFSLFSPEEVRALGQIQITESKLDISDKSNEAIQSLKSPLMGPIQNRVKCPRCTLSSPDCPGHFAYVEFPTRSTGEKVYVLHNELMPTIFKTVQSCCQGCGTPLLSQHAVETRGFDRLRGAKRLDAIAKESVKVESCRAVIKTPQGDKLCGHPNPIYYLGRDKDRGNFLRYYARGEKKVALEDMAKLGPGKIRDIFRLLALDQKALQLLGFAPGILPEHMVLENLLILPTSYRPPRVVGDKVTHNDLTNLYSEIVRVCNTINRHNLSADAEEKDAGLLFTYVATLFNNSSGAYHYANNGRPHRTLKCLMTGKGRLIRGYTQGKRVNFCIRSVASPNPRLRLRQVGIPRSLAMTVTYPEWVDEVNLVRLQRYVDDGRALMLTKAQGQYKNRILVIASLVGDMESVRRLEMGDKVDRHIMGGRFEDGVYFEGDYALVNRQPTLHKMSMMGMEVVIVEEETIQMPVNVCSPFGLDFDGDELNVHVPQTRQAQSEIRGRMSVTNNIVSPQHNRPVVALTQESLTNSYLLTNSSVIVSRSEFQQILTSTFPDLTTDEITKKISSLFRRLARTRSEKLTADGIPHHQHLISNAVRVRLAELYGTDGFRSASSSSSSSSSSCPPPSPELQRYQRRARDVLIDLYWQKQFKGDVESDAYQQWLYQRFAQARNVPAPALAVLNGTADSERRSREFARREQLAVLRQEYNDASGDEKQEVKVHINKLKSESEADQPVRDDVVLREYNEWFSSSAVIKSEEVSVMIEGMLRSDETDRHYVTGRELFSVLFPEDYFYSKENGADALEPILRIEEGIQIEGQHNKATLGATHGSIIGDLFKMYSPAHAEDLISRAKWLSDAWARTKGLSLTLETCQTLDPSFSVMMKDKIRAAKIEAYALGPRSNNPLEEARRQEVLSEISRNVKNTAGKCALDTMKSTNPDNALTIMATSGSKGNKENISSIMTMVGQQEFQGRPIPLLPGGRSIPAFERNSREPGARGFVEHNYLEGMTPAEFFLHQYSAREGLFGTALKTAETGYMQRRILKAMEDAGVYPDNTVRNAQGVVIQYSYGEDGFSGDRLVMTGGRARFIDARRMLNIIKGRRKNGLPPLFQPPASPPSQVLPRIGYVMPSFEERTRQVAVVEEEEDEDEEKKDEEEELDEGADASDISEGEISEAED